MNHEERFGAKAPRRAQPAPERTIYVAVLVVEHEPGKGKELDHALGKDWAEGVRANLVTWLDGFLTDEDAYHDDGPLFYGVRDVTLYNDEDFLAELGEYGTPDRFPDVLVDRVKDLSE